nr:RNA-directed DNA polymerase, eukaryota, reverse transcriptase zinc-binding domain protein [Tanacetum cinerariifolium]
NEKGESVSIGSRKSNKIDIQRTGGSLLTSSLAVGNSGGILCVWEKSAFKKTNSTIFDYFVMIGVSWLCSGVNLLIISVYAPQEYAEKKMLWDYMVHVISKWDGEVIVMGDFLRFDSRMKDLGRYFMLMVRMLLIDLICKKIFKRSLLVVVLSLGDVLNCFGFGAKWYGWIQECLRSSRGSVLVNGSPTEEFKFYKDLKQGDPLSPFLFILVMESLHLSFKRVEDAGMFNGIKINSSMTLSHMFYADDAIFMGQ